MAPGRDQDGRKGMFKDGEKHGQWTYWYRNGQKDREGSYFHGEKDKKWIKWRPNGDKPWEKTYEQGVQIGKGLLYQYIEGNI